MPGTLCLSCRLYKVHEEDGKPFELEMTWICEESGWKHARVRRHTDTHRLYPDTISRKSNILSATWSCVMVLLDDQMLLWWAWAKRGHALCCATSHITLACVLYVCRFQQRCRQMLKPRRRQHRKSLTWRTRADLGQPSCSRIMQEVVMCNRRVSRRKYAERRRSGMFDLSIRLTADGVQ
jgi:hypothetical protein